MILWLRDRFPSRRQSLTARVDELEHQLERSTATMRLIGGVLNPDATDRWWALHKENERLRSELSMGPRLPR